MRGAAFPWTPAAALAGLLVAWASWALGPLGGNGAEAHAEAAFARAAAGDALCAGALRDYAREAARHAAAAPLPTAGLFAARRDRAGESYFALGCPAGPMLVAMASLKADLRAAAGRP